MRARPSPLLLGCGTLLATLALTSCGGGGPAPTPTAATETPPPEPTWTSVTNADAIWQQIASAATLISPILRPSYLPPDLTEVRLVWTGADPMLFAIEYGDMAHEKHLGVAAGGVGNTDLGGPRTQQQQVVVRNTQATYQVDDTEYPLGDAWLLWEEPGKVGAPGDPNLPNLGHVTYYITSRGFSKDDLIKVADSLQPVE